LVAQGNTSTTSQSSITQILTTGLIVTFPVTAAPGTYAGTITFTLTYNGYSSTGSLGYTYTIPPTLNISVDQGLHFDIGTPETATSPTSSTGYPNAYCTITATGNDIYHITASLSALTFGSSTIPTTQLWLAIDVSPSAASLGAASAVTSNPSGLAAIRYPASSSLPAGVVTLYLCGRVSTTVSNPPGTYSGTLTLTIVAG